MNDAVPGSANVPREGVSFDGLTLIEALEHLEGEGYGAQFIARDGGMIECATCRTVRHASEMTGDHRLIRLEGASDPADMVAVAALHCTNCDARGTLVLSYGPEASPEDADILRCLDVPAGGPD